MTTQLIEVWVFYPEKYSSLITKTKQYIRAECEKRQWPLKIRPTHLIRPSGRPIGLIASQDATNLYKRIHRARVGVWQIEHADVPTQPQPKSSPRDFVPLSSFVRHKAFHKRLAGKSFGESWYASLESFAEWTECTYCEGEGDPRCLPFHAFATSLNLESLKNKDGRETFARAHGSQSSRLDDRNIKWTRGALHGKDTLNVAGCELVKGFHWDLTGKRKTRIKLPSEIWEVFPGGYLNMYPDAHIRANKQGAKRIL